jgi:SAM-dependent methyltransferase
MIGRLLRKQTLASFDYQWRELPEGGALVSDDEFTQDVERILSEELLCLSRPWFEGRTALDAGAGTGRWTIGLLRLGCRVLAVDYSTHALERLRENVERLCTSEEAARLETAPADLLAPSDELASHRFDLVFSFGVLHHTGDTRAALENIARLVADDGVLSLYLYGSGSLSTRARIALSAQRLVLAPVPFAIKRRLLQAVLRRSDLHQTFDLLSPTINTRHTLGEVKAWLSQLEFDQVVVTIPHTELFLRATRSGDALEPWALAPPQPPFWFERYGVGPTPADA